MQNEQNHANRAKLFLPFDSLKGFRDYLKCKERVVVDRKQLSSDACEELNRKLQKIQKGQMVKIIYVIRDFKNPAAVMNSLCFHFG